MVLVHLIRVKKKKLFRIPRELVHVRASIEAELRENYPSVVRYRELLKDVRSGMRHLDDMIAKHVHAEEAQKVRTSLEDLMDELSTKILKNTIQGKKDTPTT